MSTIPWRPSKAAVEAAWCGLRGCAYIGKRHEAFDEHPPDDYNRRRMRRALLAAWRVDHPKRLPTARRG
mgnify:CR=1 FL=1